MSHVSQTHSNIMSVAHNIEEKVRTQDVHITESINFSELCLSEAVLKGLTEAGFKRPSPIQLRAIPLGRCGLDLIVQAKSGTGKTCVFSVIALEGIDVTSNSTQVLVLAPTREIAIQITSVIQTIGASLEGLTTHSFIGGTAVQDDKIQAKRCHVAVGTPGRIRQLIELGSLKTASIRLFVLDEADKLLDGDFTGPINWIHSMLPSNKQILALSATYPEYLANQLTNYMRNPTFIRLNVTDPALIGIKQFHYIVPNHHLPNKIFDYKTEAILSIISCVDFQQCLIFSNQQSRAQSLQVELQENAWPTVCIAGSLDQKERNFAMDQLKTYQCRILISTDLTARGIDADKVDLVINLDVPKDHETYLHRIGRAGRFGSYGAAISIVSMGGEDKQLWAIEKKCKTQIPKLPDPIPKDLALQKVAIKLSDMVSMEKIVNHPESNMASLPHIDPVTEQNETIPAQDVSEHDTEKTELSDQLATLENIEPLVTTSPNDDDSPKKEKNDFPPEITSKVQNTSLHFPPSSLKNQHDLNEGEKYKPPVEFDKITNKFLNNGDLNLYQNDENVQHQDKVCEFVSSSSEAFASSQANEIVLNDRQEYASLSDSDVNISDTAAPSNKKQIPENHDPPNEMSVFPNPVVSGTNVKKIDVLDNKIEGQAPEKVELTLDTGTLDAFTEPVNSIFSEIDEFQGVSMSEVSVSLRNSSHGTIDNQSDPNADISSRGSVHAAITSSKNSENCTENNCDAVHTMPKFVFYSKQCCNQNRETDMCIQPDHDPDVVITPPYYTETAEGRGSEKKDMKNEQGDVSFAHGDDFQQSEGVLSWETSLSPSVGQMTCDTTIPVGQSCLISSFNSLIFPKKNPTKHRSISDFRKCLFDSYSNIAQKSHHPGVEKDELKLSYRSLPTENLRKISCLFEEELAKLFELKEKLVASSDKKQDRFPLKEKAVNSKCKEQDTYSLIQDEENVASRQHRSAQQKSSDVSEQKHPKGQSDIWNIQSKRNENKQIPTKNTCKQSKRYVHEHVERENTSSRSFCAQTLHSADICKENICSTLESDQSFETDESLIHQALPSEDMADEIPKSKKQNKYSEKWHSDQLYDENTGEESEQTGEGLEHLKDVRDNKYCQVNKRLAKRRLGKNKSVAVQKARGKKMEVELNNDNGFHSGFDRQGHKGECQRDFDYSTTQTHRSKKTLLATGRRVKGNPERMTGGEAHFEEDSDLSSDSIFPQGYSDRHNRHFASVDINSIRHSSKRRHRQKSSSSSYRHEQPDCHRPPFVYNPSGMCPYCHPAYSGSHSSPYTNCCPHFGASAGARSCFVCPACREKSRHRTPFHGHHQAPWFHCCHFVPPPNRRHRSSCSSCRCQRQETFLPYYSEYIKHMTQACMSLAKQYHAGSNVSTDESSDDDDYVS